jgi:hypothetical protein
MKRFAPLSALLAASLAGGCHGHFGDDPAPVYHDEPVSIEIEVYDPNTNYVWQDVSVRIIEVDHEWSGLIWPNPTKNDFYYTDKFGVVYFSPERLAVSDLGFLEDDIGRAVLSPDYLEDEATVLVEISAPGLGRVYERIELSWDEPRVYVQVPF